jgi:hypothetical protein
VPTEKKRITLIPDDDALAVLGRDLTADGATMAVNGALAEYAAVVERSARDLGAVLTRPEWNAIADVMNGCADLMDYGGPTIGPILMVTANLQDSPGIDKKWKIDTADLCRRLSALTAAHGYAILAAVRWFWAHPDEINHGKDVWWSVAFRHAARQDD